VDMLVPLYFGRLAAFCRQVAPLEEEQQVEEVIEQQAQVFEQEKHYLVQNWT